MKSICIVCTLLAGLFVMALLVLQPRIDIQYEQKLVGPEERAIQLLSEGRPLQEIKNAVQASGKAVDEISWWDGSLLYWAVDKKRLDVAEWLLAEGASPNGTHPSEAPLRAAIVREHVPMVELLIKAGADPDLPAQAGPVSTTPRDLAEAGGNPDVMAALPKRTKPMQGN
jgi:hypothetical protein